MLIGFQQIVFAGDYPVINLALKSFNINGNDAKIGFLLIFSTANECLVFHLNRSGCKMKMLGKRMLLTAAKAVDQKPVIRLDEYDPP
ncbi:hypothetical protein D3C71_1905420 [compost metagenome]